MQFKISGRRLEVTEPIHDYAQQKTEKLHRYYDKIQAISVVIDQHDDHGKKFEVEIVLDIEHHSPIVATDKGEDLYAGIDQVVLRAERQLTDLKEKLRNRKHLTG
jgi:putative sigma-54 modulation protein